VRRALVPVPHRFTARGIISAGSTSPATPRAAGAVPEPDVSRKMAWRNLAFWYFNPFLPLRSPYLRRFCLAAACQCADQRLDPSGISTRRRRFLGRSATILNLLSSRQPRSLTPGASPDRVRLRGAGSAGESDSLASDGRDHEIPQRPWRPKTRASRCTAGTAITQSTDRIVRHLTEMLDVLRVNLRRTRLRGSVCVTARHRRGWSNALQFRFATMDSSRGGCPDRR